jgi:hypothetical protein
MDVAYEPLPLVIGVTGHRDLRDEDIPLLEQEVEKVFENLERFLNPHRPLMDGLRRIWYGNASNASTPTIVLSSLAEGADQLVARIALKRGLRLIAPLPFPLEEYRRDFKVNPVRPDAVKTFDAWMARPGIQKLFVGYENDGSLEDAQRDSEKRDLQYRRTGAFIARHCDVLIALWDGETAASTGGTAEIVAFKRHGIPLKISGSGRASLDTPEIGPVIHVITPRAAKPGSATAVSVERWGEELKKRYKALDDIRKRRSATEAEKQKIEKELAPVERDYRLWQSFEATIGLNREFNREAARLLASKNGRANAKRSLDSLLHITPKKPDVALQHEVQATGQHYCSLYAVADSLAQRWQKVFQHDWSWLFCLGLFAFVCFEAFAHLHPIMKEVFAHLQPLTKDGRGPVVLHVIDIALLIGYIAAFMVIFLRYFLAVRRQHQERFLDYRALAEALRVATFWKLTGIHKAADAYPVKMPRELAWVKTCLLTRELHDAADNKGIPGSLNEMSYDWVRRIWIAGQAAYFKKRRPAHLEKAQWRESWAKRILVAAVVFAGLLLALALVIAGEEGSWISRDTWPHSLFLFTIGAMPGVAAVLFGYSEKLAFNAQARQYDRMAELFTRALEILPPTLLQTNPDLARDALRELGTEAMRENAEWVSLYRQRPISPL